MSRLKGVSLDPASFSSDSDTATLEQTAAALVEAGISILPIKTDGTKAPAFPWKSFQSRRPNRKELSRWFNNGSKYGIGAIGGKVSGGLTILDFDEPELFEPWQALVEGASGSLLDDLPIVLTPSGGIHVFFRCEEIAGNQKLAQREGENGPEVMIETRGEGGYVLLPGCPPECHSEGEYILLCGDLTQIPTILKAECLLLLNSARSFDEPSFAGNGDAPNHADNPVTMTWSQILEPFGWRKAAPRCDGATNWTRPGKGRGVSATTNFANTGKFHPFSTNSGQFEAGRFYTKSEAYTLLNHGESPVSEIWPDVSELPALLPKAPALDPVLLPQSLSPWLFDESERMQVPLEMVAIPAYTALGSVVGRACSIYPKEFDDWQVIVNSWAGVVARSGLLKSPSQQRGLRPLDVLVGEAEKEYAQDRLEASAGDAVYKAKIKAVEGEITAAIKEGLSCSALQAKLASVMKERDENHQTERRFRTSDPTVEKLAELMKENCNGLLLIRDELSGWLLNLEKDNRQGDREFYLESWAGDSPFTVDRIARGTIKVPALCLSIIGGITPGKLSRYVTAAVEEGWGDDGLLQRFQLLVWPEMPSTWKNVDRRPDMKAYKQAVEVFRRLDRLKKVKSVRLLGGVPGLHFDPDAQEFFNYWLWSLEHRLRSDEITCEAFRSHLAKYRSLMPSLALLTHLADASGNEPVSMEAAEKSALLCDFLEAHALKIYAPAINPELQSAHTLSKKIKAGEVKGGSTVRELYRNQWSGLTTPASVRSGLRVLEEYGWLRCKRVGTDGRSTEIVELNPALKNDNAQKAH